MFGQCNCGSAGGCDKCRPKDARVTVTYKKLVGEYKPSPRFDPNKFYRPIKHLNP